MGSVVCVAASWPVRQQRATMSSERGQGLYIFAYLAGVIWLLAWEASAFIRHRPDLTISDFTWTLRGWWYVPRALIGVGLVVLALHLLFGWFRYRIGR